MESASWMLVEDVDFNRSSALGLKVALAHPTGQTRRRVKRNQEGKFICRLLRLWSPHSLPTLSTALCLKTITVTAKPPMMLTWDILDLCTLSLG